MSNQTVTLLNKTWKPLLALVIVISVFFIYVTYPMLYNIGYFVGFKPNIPTSTIEHLNALLLGGGTLAALRTIEKKINAIDKKLTNTKFEEVLDVINKLWRPALAFTIILSLFFLYFIVPAEEAFINVSASALAPSIIYDKLNELVITGGLLAGLKAYENAANLSDIH